jgi:hypothetical protein
MRAVCTTHLILLLFHHSNAIRRGIQIMKDLVLTSIRTQYKHNNAFCGSVVQTISTHFVRFFIFPYRHYVTQRQRHLLTLYAAHLNPTTHKTHLPKRQHTSAPIPAVQNN